MSLPHHNQFNTVGDAGVAGYHVLRVAGTGVVSVAVGVGAGYASFDKDRKHILSGASWLEGKLALMGDVFDGEKTWKKYESLIVLPSNKKPSSYYCVLRSYSMSFYKSPSDDPAHVREADEIVALNLLHSTSAYSLHSNHGSSASLQRLE